MKIAGILRQDSGVGFYRIGQPTKFIDAVSKEKSRITPFTGTGRLFLLADVGKPDVEVLSDKTLMEICDKADIIWCTFIANQDELLKLLNLREWSGAKLVFDMDDDLYNIPRDNPNKAKVEAKLPMIERGLMLADGLTVSTPRLKEAYFHLNQNIYVNPNGQDIDFWNDLIKKTKLKPHPGVRIGWRGANGHDSDLRLIEPAIKAIQKDHNVTFVTIGAKPPFKTEHIDWVSQLDYPKTLIEANLDMALVPLVDSPYNKCKSSIAVQEFGALGIPVIASPTENQKDFPIPYATTNYEWYEEIEKMVKNKKYRQQLGSNLKSHIRKNYNVANFTPDLIDWFKNLPRKELKPE